MTERIQAEQEHILMTVECFTDSSQFALDKNKITCFHTKLVDLQVEKKDGEKEID
jgi:hypothetical protein